jgi:hypothetical protein
MKVKKLKGNKINSPTASARPALRRAALAARKIARMYGTPIYFLRDGKVVAEKP